MLLSRELAGTVGAFLKNTEFIFPIGTVETACPAILAVFGAGRIKTVKSRLFLHKLFECFMFVVDKMHTCPPSRLKNKCQ